MTFSDTKIVDYETFMTKQNAELTELAWLYNLNRGIFATPGREEEWTLSVTHTEEAADDYIAVFEELARDLTGLGLASPSRRARARTELVGRHGDGWKARVAAPPERGRANEALVALLASVLEVPPGSIRVVGGQRGRAKVVEVDSLGARGGRAPARAKSKLVSVTRLAAIVVLAFALAGCGSGVERQRGRIAGDHVDLADDDDDFTTVDADGP